MTRKAVTVCSAWLLCISFLAVGFSPSVTSATECHPIVATATSVQGRVEVRRVHVTQWQPVRLNDIFCAGDCIRVGNRSRAEIALANRAVLRLDQNTSVTLGGIHKEQTSLVDIIEGAVYFFSPTTRMLEVPTELVNAGIEETDSLTGGLSVLSEKRTSADMASSRQARNS